MAYNAKFIFAVLGRSASCPSRTNVSQKRSNEKYLRFWLLRFVEYRNIGKFSPYLINLTANSTINLVFVPSQRVFSDHGLLTTVAYQFGPKTPPVYALEGSIGIAGTVLSWLKDNLNIFEDFSEIEKLVSGASNDLFFVPSFYGLDSPSWRFNKYRLVLFVNWCKILSGVLLIDCFERSQFVIWTKRRYSTKWHTESNLRGDLLPNQRHFRCAGQRLRRIVR